MTQEERTEIENEINNAINNEILPILETINKVIASEQGKQIIANAAPIVAQYASIMSNMYPVFVEPIASFKADAVSSLQLKGFTREEAIKLMSR